MAEPLQVDRQASAATLTSGTLNGDGYGHGTNFGVQTPARGEPEAAPPSETGASDEAQMQSCRAFILNLSHTGALLVSEAAPVEGHSIWVRLDGPESSDWVEGSLRGVSNREPGKFLVRLAFRDACPYDFFKRAVFDGFGK